MAAVRVTIEIHYRWNFIQKMRDMQIDRPRQIHSVGDLSDQF